MDMLALMGAVLLAAILFAVLIYGFLHGKGGIAKPAHDVHRRPLPGEWNPDGR